MKYELEDYKEERKIGVKILLILIFFTLILILVYSLYLLFSNIPGSPVTLNVSVETGFENTSTYEAKQFYHNMKYNHNNISYSFYNGCNDKEKERMKKAFDEIKNKVNSITFIEVNENPDIDIECEEKTNGNFEEGYLIAGEGGAKEIIPTGRFNVIKKGVIYLYNNEEKGFVQCENSNVEIHELMHALGFDHSNSENSLMYFYLDSCTQTLENSFTGELSRLYSLENLPDLYFDKINVVKKRRYLNFNVTIRNSGSVSSENITLEVLDNGESIDTFNVENINYGGGIVIQTTNFRLKRSNPEKIEFVIDKNNEIKEMDEENNIVMIEPNKI